MNTNEIVGLIIGALFSGWGIYMRNKRVKLVQKGIKVDGTVVRIEKITSVDNDGKSYTYKPVVKYPIAYNEWITKVTNPNLSLPLQNRR